MSELPCFLTYERVGMFGDCTSTFDPLIMGIQILTLSFIGLFCGGVIYYGLKMRKEKKAQQTFQKVDEK